MTRHTPRSSLPCLTSEGANGRRGEWTGSCFLKNTTCPLRCRHARMRFGRRQDERRRRDDGGGRQVARVARA